MTTPSDRMGLLLVAPGAAISDVGNVPLAFVERSEADMNCPQVAHTAHGGQGAAAAAQAGPDAGAEARPVAPEPTKPALRAMLAQALRNTPHH